MLLNKRFYSILIIAGFILLLPLIAMQFTSEVNWSFSDFLIAGTLLLTAGLLCELILQKVKNKEFKMIFCFAIILLLFLVWAELAVGLFGTPLAGS